MTIRELIDELRAASEVVGADAPVGCVLLHPQALEPDELKLSEIVTNRQRCVIRAVPMSGHESDVFFGAGYNGF